MSIFANKICGMDLSAKRPCNLGFECQYASKG